LAPDLIGGRKNEWERIYDPSRFNPFATGESVRDNVEVVASLAEWLTPGELSSREDIAPGTGAWIRSGPGKRTFSRDPDGAFFECPAVCIHLGCIVSWNAAAESWDCPPAGSRLLPQIRVVAAQPVLARGREDVDDHGIFERHYAVRDIRGDCQRLAGAQH